MFFSNIMNNQVIKTICLLTLETKCVLEESQYVRALTALAED